MLKTRSSTKMSPENVTRAWEKGRGGALRKAAALVYKIARNSIRRRKNVNLSSPRGTPPFTHSGKLKYSIRYTVTKLDAFVGTTASSVGQIGGTHEKGGTETTRTKPYTGHTNWKIEVGGHGPIRIRKTPDISRANFNRCGITTQSERWVEFAKLKSEDMVRRSWQTIAMADSDDLWDMQQAVEHKIGQAPDRNYPARPFMGPALDKALRYQEFRQAFSDSVKK